MENRVVGMTERATWIYVLDNLTSVLGCMVIVFFHYTVLIS